MSRILLVEPQTILRQAIRLCLFPEHDVVVERELTSGQVRSLQGYDLLIVDGAALAESGPASPEATSALQSTEIPTIWLDDSDSSQAPTREKLRVLKRPLERESFRAAVDELLAGHTDPKHPAKIPGAGTSTPPKRNAKRRTVKSSDHGSLGLVDLVDVVEEDEALDVKPSRPGNRNNQGGKIG